MPTPRTLGLNLRWLLLAAALLSWLAGAFYLLNVLWPQWEFLPISPPNEFEPAQGAGLIGVMGWTFHKSAAPGYYASLALYLGLFLLTQYLFLSPSRLWKPTPSATPRPLKRSILAASLMTALLSVALIATLLHLLNLWSPMVYPETRERVFENPRLWPPLLILALSWLLWSILLFRYARTLDHATFTSKLLRGLFAGSLLETLIAAPAHALVRHPEECYCMRGSYTGLIFGVTILFWTFGPAIALLFYKEKRRLQQLTPEST
ncbi:MAG: hypothetical protein IT442_17615 [Phycisphaeraceae bacterium]|nr:hypothetical protein [Phycisphaeraceae bacterium]